MANEPDVIDLTESFTLVDHSDLANTVIDLDDSVVVVPDSPQVPSSRFDVSVQTISNRISVMVTRSNRGSGRNTSNITRRRTRSTANTNSNNNITIENIHAHSVNLAPPKVPRKESQTVAELKNKAKMNDTNGECSPVKIGNCPICFDRLGKNPLASTKCGHVFCTACLEHSLRLGKKCPTCRTALRGSSAYHRLFLTGD